MAQMVAYQFCTLVVAGSSPALGSMKLAICKNSVIASRQDRHRMKRHAKRLIESAVNKTCLASFRVCHEADASRFLDG